jgi:outer membrane murein-binding lipoprotein Lpp
MKLFAAVLAVLFLLGATSTDVASDVATDGYHVDPNTSATNECVSASVSDARNAGANLSIVVLVEEPPGGATTFSETTLDALGTVGTVFTVAPESIGYRDTEEFWTVAQFNAALDEANSVASDNDVVRTFVNTLTGDDAVCSNVSTAGKSGWGFLVFVLIVAGGIVFLVWRSSRSNKERKKQNLATAKEPLQAQIDAIANDILELEDEVREAANGEATDHFNLATESFTTASDRLARANSPQALLNLGYDLDVTIWRLDCAEAILDGNPTPPQPVKPEPPKPKAPPPPVDHDPDRTDDHRGGSDVAGLPKTLPEYPRREARKSQYGSDGLMAALLAMQAMQGLGGRRSGGTWTGSSGGWSGPRSSSGGRSRSSTPKNTGSRGGRRRG